ncbi:hypothetical protein J4D99_05355 [Siccationidurans ginsengisoli]|uniref:hypothetical protein n=1 Tax=Hymenobacter TaxID=89966 RepID=UPI001AAC78DC|nr:MULTISPECIES: hypothetical protein [unclassified Hymenobacter]MBO2030811.1 hypothetical protein [Hymenobacter sp. BT559]
MLHDVDVINAYEKYGNDVVKHMPLQPGQGLGERVSELYMRNSYAWLTGNLVGWIVSAIIARCTRVGYWLPVGVVVVAILISRSGFYHSRALDWFIYYLQKPYHLVGLVPTLVVEGILFLFLALWVFFTTNTRSLARV